MMLTHQLVAILLLVGAWASPYAAAFSIAPENGRLTLVGIEKTGGQSPRNFNLDPSGRFLIAANRNTSDIHVFSVDPESGALEPEAGRLEVPHPVCVLFI